MEGVASRGQEIDSMEGVAFRGQEIDSMKGMALRGQDIDSVEGVAFRGQDIDSVEAWLPVGHLSGPFHSDWCCVTVSSDQKVHEPCVIWTLFVIWSAV